MKAIFCLLLTLKENLEQHWFLSRGDPTFCVPSTPREHNYTQHRYFPSTRVWSGGWWGGGGGGGAVLSVSRVNSKAFLIDGKLIFPVRSSDRCSAARKCL